MVPRKRSPGPLGTTCGVDVKAKVFDDGSGMRLYPLGGVGIARTRNLPDFTRRFAKSHDMNREDA